MEEQQQKLLLMNSSATTTTQQLSSTQLQGVSVSKEEDKSADEDDDQYFDSFPPGFRFCPHDYELILHYLMKKVTNCPLPRHRIKDVNLMHYNPEDLIEEYKAYGEKDWFFFTPRDRKYPNGDRPSRAAGDGYWKATGADKLVHNNNDEDDTLVGYKKALVFYKGKPPKGVKTNWIMHEYRVLDNVNPRIRHGENDMRLDDCVLCRVYKKADKASKKPQQKESVPVPPPPRLSNDDSTAASEQAVPFPEQSVQQNLPNQQEQISYGIDQSIQYYNCAEPQEIRYGNDYRFPQQSVQQNLPKHQEESYGNECPFDQSIQYNCPEPQEISYGNDYQFDQSVLQQNLAAESQDPSYGNFSSRRANMGFNSHNHDDLRVAQATLSWIQTNSMMCMDINRMNSNQPFSQYLMDSQLPASSMNSCIQVGDSQPSTTLDPFSRQYWDNMQVPKSTPEDNCINQVIQNCDSVHDEQSPPLPLAQQPQPQPQPPLAQQPQPSPLKRRRTSPE
ncbi:hypothetical protein HHK36_007765 [Tetracentron sinense]|uniref:NAC domain-containing protein n=1 Tax=Tetracentron sinense TaxID=13715 RepID=A0A835DJA2_TETSI|nr:hypothetical protein HHK36_007765 [Tetracentron sinense]